MKKPAQHFVERWLYGVLNLIDRWFWWRKKVTVLKAGTIGRSDMGTIQKVGEEGAEVFELLNSEEEIIATCEHPRPLSTYGFDVGLRSIHHNYSMVGWDQ
jgi:hypothetical protein